MLDELGSTVHKLSTDMNLTAFTLEKWAWSIDIRRRNRDIEFLDRLAAVLDIPRDYIDEVEGAYYRYWH